MIELVCNLRETLDLYMIKEVDGSAAAIVLRSEIPPEELDQYRPATQKDLSDLSGVRPNVISDLSNLNRTVININHITKIANTLKIKDIRQLISFT